MCTENSSYDAGNRLDTVRAAQGQGLADREIARRWGIPWGTFHRERQKRGGLNEWVSAGVSQGVSLGPREKTERWNLHLPQDVVAQTKARAQALGVHPSELVAEVLRHWLSEG
jgi:hypothetical protein